MTDSKNQVHWLALLGLTGIALYLCWEMLRPFFFVLIWATVIVIIFFPVQRWVVKKTKRAGLSALITIVILLATVILPLLLITSLVVNELSIIAVNTQRMLQDLLSDPVKGEQFRHVLDSYRQELHLDQVISPDKIRELIEKASQTLLKGTLNVLGGTLGVVFNAFLVLFTMYYLFRDGEKIVEVLPTVLPLSQEQSLRIFSRTQEIINASVYGVLVIATVQGMLGGLMFWILGLPSALVWGMVMVLLSTIPVLGAFVVWLPAALYLALTGHWIRAIILTIWGAVVIHSADNILRPRLVGEKTQLHELLVFFSVLGGLQVFGILGILLGPVVLAITLALVGIQQPKERSS